VPVSPCRVAVVCGNRAAAQAKPRAALKIGSDHVVSTIAVVRQFQF
jgi:hypothetical protein